MGISVAETIANVHRLGRDMHPGLSLNKIKHRVVLLSHSLVHLSVIRQWYDKSDNPFLTEALKLYPLMSGAIYWPYINHAWAMEQKLSTIDQHFRMLGGQAAIIAQSLFEEVELSRLEDYPGLRFVLDKAAWFVREGEVVLNLFVDDKRCYSIAFTLGVDSGLPLVYVGALQGGNTASAMEIYRGITHALHGMRPRDLLMTALKQLCNEIGIHRIWAVSSTNRQHNSPYFGNSHDDKVRVDYNEVWMEHKGVALDNGFFEIPTIVMQKDMSEIPTRKRAVYRRRYAMLDRLSLDIKSSCAKHAEKSLTMNTKP